ncbi:MULTISPECIES: beta-galactosidase family protein [unclassified Microbacterium]|uniref:glycoside hydrolase family 35 protein n=1 Tax=unclassified Microbacterium TaxID=2609290 RepID=UPI00214BB5F9|nr:MULTISPECIES: beta-galactosidase family protein [unclassified Microbacterium]MCR2783462.1 beta-galactosidase [Microbacterium sp. zg.B96]WIM15674.1 beta-galactosidase [Microbacterium sp. zg-B96]
MTSRFQIGETDFLLDGEPHRIISGAMHYPRVHPDLWRDRLRKAKLMGLNAIETYVFWNAHEPVPGQWDASGALDLGRFLDLIAEEGMHAIVRPGPYVCAEWHNGGLPTWLTADTEMTLRSSDPTYLAAVTSYLDRVNAIVAPRQIDQGGSVILVQIENEYGAYGSDKAYLAELIRVTRAAGITVPLTQVDQPIPHMLTGGAHEGLHKTGSFGARISERLTTLREHQPTGPLMCMEFWCGWFDHWGEKHHTTTFADSARDLDELLTSGASVNIYMVHGGTNFGLTNGANDSGRYLPMVTSYDYDSPISESGDITEKFRAFRDVIAKHAPVPDEPLPEPVDAPVLSVPLESVGDPLPLVAIDRGTFATPPTLDELGPQLVLAEYAAAIDTDRTRVLEADVRDYAWVSVDDRPTGILQRTIGDLALPVPAGSELRMLVEETGRVNYDTKIGEPKGIVGDVRLDGEPIAGLWHVRTFDVPALAQAVADAAPGGTLAGGRAAGPVGLRGSFELAASADLFLDTAGWGKGYAWVNGFFLGRYWRRGPQRTLYVPGPVTRAGRNDLVIVELETLTDATARFVARPNLGHEVE